MRNKYRIDYTVRGQRDFPIDMLRYDGSEAATPYSKHRIEAFTFDKVFNKEITYEEYKAIREIDLVALVEFKSMFKFIPCDARWKSFQWEVIRKSITKI